MGMTEKQEASDVRANTTRADLIAQDEYEITGHKWFMSAPMCDAFLILAQAHGRPHLLSRAPLSSRRPAQRLASPEAEGQARQPIECLIRGRIRQGLRLADRRGRRGVPTIIEMVQLTRLDCVSSSAGLMRMGLALAMHHARHRSAFQKKLVDQPAMRSTLADLALSVEGTAAVTLRLARAFDRMGEEPSEAAYARLMTPAVKFAVCKAAPGFLYETMECLGGNGYVEDSPLTPGFIAKRRSTRSGKAPATSWRSTCCAPRAATGTRHMACSPSFRARRRGSPASSKLRRSASKAVSPDPMPRALRAS